MDKTFYITDVFGISKYTGNQLATVILSEVLSQEEMQIIAKEFIKSKKISLLQTYPSVKSRWKYYLPEADLILLSLDGTLENHNAIRGNTYDAILTNIELS